MSQLTRWSRLLRVSVVASLAACGGGDGGTTNPTPAGFTVSLSSTTLAVEQGSSGSVTATIGRTGTFTGTVNLSVEGVPSGLTASFSPTAITSGTTSTTLTVAVAASVTPGSYSFTIRGQAAEVSAQQTGTVTVTVTNRPTISMALSATAGSVTQGGNTSFTATITRTNFTGALTVATTGAPAGVTATVTNAADVYTVAVAVGAATVAGTYTLTTTASGTGVTAVSATYALTVTPAAPTVSLAATPAALSVTPGGATVASTIAITRANFTGAVTLAVQSGLPSGATATFNPSGATTAASATVTIGADVSTAPGTYTVVIAGTGQGATTGTTQIALTVNPLPTSIALSASPSALSIQQGANGATTINIARTNFPGAVTLAATGLPANVTASFTTSPTTGNSATLTLTVAAGAATGTSTITVTGSGTGVSNATTTVSLTVTPQSSGSSVVFAFCSPNIPVWFASQNGAGAWTQVTAGPNNTYTTTIGSQGGIAYVMPSGGGGYVLSIIYGTGAELAGTGQTSCTTPVTKSVTGSVSGFGQNNTDLASVFFGGGSAIATSATPNFNMSTVLTGSQDLIGTRFSLDLITQATVLNKIFLKRGLNPPNGGSVGTVDFNGTDAFDPDTKSVTVNGLVGGEQVSMNTSFQTSTATSAGLTALTLASGSTSNVSIVPSAKTQSGDLQVLTASASVTSGSDLQLRTVTTAFRDPGNQTVTLGAVLSTPTVTTVATAPYARLRSVLARQSDYANSWTASFSQGTITDSRAAFIIMTSGYIGSATSFDVTIPDFTGVAGWQSIWGLQSGMQTGWTTSASGWVAGSGGVQEGSIIRLGTRHGTITP